MHATLVVLAHCNRTAYYQGLTISVPRLFMSIVVSFHDLFAPGGLYPCFTVNFGQLPLFV